MRYSPDPSQPKESRTPDQARVAGQGLVFGTAAALYEAGRPGYPLEAARWLVGSASTVVDVGAGTGKFTRQLVDLAEHVIAVEPDAAMLAQLRAQSPNVEAHIGTAESIPLPDGCADVITVAQAWHWVDLDLAVPEAARVLRPGGVLGLIWNVRDESHGWVSELGEMIHRGGSQQLESDDPIVGPPFAPLERRNFEWLHVVTLEQFLAMIASRSYVIAMSDDERAAVLNEAEVFVLAQPGQSRERITIPYVTHAYRTTSPS